MEGQLMRKPYRERPWRNRLYNIRVATSAIFGKTGTRTMWKTVNGYVCPPFAARRTEAGRWSCDHVPTGASVGSFRLLSDAKEYARELVDEAGFPEMWEGFTEVGDMPHGLREVNQRVGERHGQLLRGVV